MYKNDFMSKHYILSRIFWANSKVLMLSM